MNKQNLIQQHFQKKNLLTTANPTYQKHLSDLFHWTIKADDITRDITSSTLQLKGNGTAKIISKQNGILAGIEEITYLLHTHTKLKVDSKLNDGSPLIPQQPILSICGKNKDILARERIVLNVLGKMSGIATKTNHLTSLLKNTTLSLAATRKTPWMYLDKKAVAIGGGLTHRLNLSDWTLIKDNHLNILQKTIKGSPQSTIEEAIKRMIASHTTFFEIEVETPQQAETAIKSFQNKTNQSKEFSMALLLDNFNPITINQLLNNLQNSPQIILEASGGITEENLLSWTKTKVDILSLGALTHSSKNFDFSMSII